MFQLLRVARCRWLVAVACLAALPGEGRADIVYYTLGGGLTVVLQGNTEVNAG